MNDLKIYLGLAPKLNECLYKPYFTQREWNHINSLENSSARNSRLFGRWWLKMQMGCSAEGQIQNHIEFDKHLKFCEREVPIKVSLSHSKDWCFIVCLSSSILHKSIIGVGCDIEDKEITEKPISKILHSSDVIREQDKQYLWSIKEACFKAIPNNQGIQLHQIVVNTANNCAYFENYVFSFYTFCVNDYVCVLSLSKKPVLVGTI